MDTDPPMSLLSRISSVSPIDDDPRGLTRRPAPSPSGVGGGLRKTPVLTLPVAIGLIVAAALLLVVYDVHQELSEQADRIEDLTAQLDGLRGGTTGSGRGGLLDAFPAALRQSAAVLPRTQQIQLLLDSVLGNVWPTPANEIVHAPTVPEVAKICSSKSLPFVDGVNAGPQHVRPGPEVFTRHSPIASIPFPDNDKRFPCEWAHFRSSAPRSYFACVYPRGEDLISDRLLSDGIWNRELTAVLESLLRSDNQRYSRQFDRFVTAAVQLEEDERLGRTSVPTKHGSTTSSSASSSSSSSSSSNLSSASSEELDSGEFEDLMTDPQLRGLTNRRLSPNGRSSAHSNSNANANALAPLSDSLFPFIVAAMDAPLVIDVGSHVGAFSLLFAAHGRRVLAVEPSSANQNRLVHSLHHVRNAHLAPFVRAVRCAVSDRWASDHLIVNRFNRGWSFPATVELPQAERVSIQQHEDEDFLSGDSIDVYTLDDLVQERVELLKISTGGQEARILRGGYRLLCHHRVHYVVAEFSARHQRADGCETKALIRWLYGCDYRLVRLNPSVVAQDGFIDFSDHVPADGIDAWVDERAESTQTVLLVYAYW